MRFILRLVLNALALIAIAYYVPGIHVSSFMYALIAAVVLGLVNAVLGTIIKIVALPVTILTLGLFTLVINAFLFWLTSYLLDGFDVTTFTAALIGSILMSVASWIIHLLLYQD